MRTRPVILLSIAFAWLPTQAFAQSIFNVPTNKPTPVVGKNSTAQGARAGTAPASEPHYDPYVPPAASVVPLTAADAELVKEYERLPNEGEEEYDARMKERYDKALDEMRALSVAAEAKMRALRTPPR